MSIKEKDVAQKFLSLVIMVCGVVLETEWTDDNIELYLCNKGNNCDLKKHENENLQAAPVYYRCTHNAGNEK